MKYLKVLSIIFLISIYSCGGDDPVCEQADFIGTWVGTEECDLNSMDNNVTITITALGGDLQIDGGQFVTDRVSIDDCDVSADNSTLGIGFEYSGSLADSSLLLIHTTKTGIENLDCVYNLTKQ